MSNDIIFNTSGGWGTITLNAPQRLNALSEQMCVEMSAKLAEWREDSAIQAVMIKAAAGSRAFCAGGDIRSLYELRKSGDTAQAVRFFANEYVLNWRIAQFPKPYLALIDGAVMGGGFGVSAHGKYRLATEKAIFAMPECGIGLYPDVGATHFLPRLRGASGIWLGLTGARIEQKDMLGLGIATHTVASDMLEDAESRLHDVDWSDGPDEAIETALDDIHTVLEGSAPAMDARHEIDNAFSKPSMEEIYASLEEMGTDWSAGQIAALDRGAPLSLKVTLRALKTGKDLNIAEALEFEYALTKRFIEEGKGIIEGIRAAVVDKDRNPSWPHSSLADVTEDELNAMFMKDDDSIDLSW